MKECLRLITERRSITFFDPTREVPDELIKEILEISATAPSGYNLQPWEVAKEKLKENIQRGWTDRERAIRKAIRDTALFCMTVMIVARAYGLETHPMEGFDEERLKEFFGVDKDKVIPVMLAIGYKDPQRELLPRAYRFKFEEFGRFL